jgi:hypothetical protein
MARKAWIVAGREADTRDVVGDGRGECTEVPALHTVGADDRESMILSHGICVIS